MAVKKSPTKPAPTAIVKWDTKFAKYAKEGKSQTKDLAQDFAASVKFGRNSISVNGEQLKQNTLDIIILNNCAVNTYYEAEWDTETKAPPDCFAIGTYSRDEDDLPVLNPMVPHSVVRHKQAETCDACPQNEFGSAIRGKGKACGNRLRIAVKLAKDAAEDPKTAEVATALLSPTNVGRFTKYQNSVLDEYGRPLWAVVTQVSSYDDPKTQVRVEFKMVELIEDDALLTQLEKDYAGTLPLLQQPYQAVSDEQRSKTKEKAPAKKTAAGSKFAGGKHVSR